jgi:PAS domain S-box-containing protein
VVEAAPNAMIMVGADGVMTLVNVQTEKLFGYDRQELLGRPMEMLMPERFRSHHGSHRRKFFATPATRPMGAVRDLFGLRKDGSEVPIEIGLNPISTPDGQFVLASIIDITERKKAQELHQLFKALIEGVKDYGIFMLDPEGRVLSWNEGAARMKGYSENDILGKHHSCFYTPEAVSLGHPADELRIARAEGRFEEEGWRVRRDGSRFWASVLITSVLDDDGNFLGFSKLTRDITERKHSEERLLESERSLRLLADAMPQIVWTAKPNGYVDYYNRRWYEFTGVAENQGGDESWKRILHPEDLQFSLNSWYDAVASGLPFEIQYRFWDRRSNSWRWHLCRALPIRDEKGQVAKWVGTSTDIDDHKRLNEDLEKRVEQRTQDLLQSLSEKETLLKEVHHRVKNNLQVICSLLALQIESSSGNLSNAPLQNAYDRVQSMALIHERLYQSPTLSDLDFGAYIEILAGQLLHAYCVDTELINLELSVEAVHFTIDQAIPCGLILNELISNSLKHAFRDGRRGVIRISFAHVSPERVRLTVADSGVGLPNTFALEAAPSLGLQIVRTLAGQLGANLQLVTGEGAHFAIEWPLETVTK